MKYVAMIGPDPEAQGGMASVIKAYRSHGLFERWPVFLLPTFVGGNKIKNVFVAGKSLALFVALLMTDQVAVTHVHVAQRTSFLRKAVFLSISLLFHRPVIFHLHGAEFDTYYENDCGKRLKHMIRFLLDRSSYVVVLSSYWRDWISKVTRNAHIERLYNPVAIPEYVLAGPPENFKVLFLGRLGGRKGTYDLLKAVAALQGQYPSLQLLCGGDGEVEAVRKLAESLGIMSQVKLLGWVRGQDKERLLSEAAVFVLPSYHEGLPMAILEAMAHGIPVISTRVGGIPEAIEDGKEGILIVPGDVVALTAGIECLLKDSALRIRMGKAAHDKAARLFAIDKVLAQVDEMYYYLGAKPNH